MDEEDGRRSPPPYRIDSSQSNFPPSSKSFDFQGKYKDEKYDQEMEVDEFDDSDGEISRKKAGRQKKRKVITDSDNDAVEIYCICRTSKTDCFMICCDKCEDWFHGDCVKITQYFSKKIQNYYCPLCREKDPTLEIKLKETLLKPKKEKTVKIEETRVKVEKEISFPFDVKNKRGIIDSEDEKDNYSPEEDEDDDDDEFKIAGGVGEKNGPKRKYHKKVGRPRKLEEKSKSKAKRGRKTKKTKGETKGRGRKNVDKKSHEHHRRGRHKIQSDDSQDEMKANLPRQCFGPECINASRKGSKYCSDQCAIQLATNRIMEILPHRIVEWQKIPCAADQLSLKELEEIRREQNHATAILADIDRKQVELDAIVEKGKSCLPYSEEESAEIVDNEPDNDCVIHCITCSQEISLKLVCD